MNPVVDVVLAVLAAACEIIGALFVLASAAAMFRVRDALSRINVFSPATGLGLPLLVLGVLLENTRINGFDLMTALMSALTVVALASVASVASNVLSRSAYLSAAPIDPATHPQELAEAPEEDPAADISGPR